MEKGVPPNHYLFGFLVLIVLRVPVSSLLSFNPRDFITNCSVSCPVIHVYRPTDAGTSCSRSYYLSKSVNYLAILEHLSTSLVD